VVPRSSLLPPRVPSTLAGPQSLLPKGQARICAGRDVTARFVENAVIEAGRKVHILDAVKQSEVSAKEQVEVGVEGKARARGHIVGGITRATLLVKAAVLGSPGEVTTIIEVGPGAKLLETFESARAEVERLEATQGELARTLAKARTSGTLTAEAEARDEVALSELGRKLDARIQERDALQAQIHLAAKAKVVARERVYAGVLFRIGERALLAGESRGASACQLDQGRLSFVLP
jgi:uncharacterized protein (DUF342 family)